MVQKCVAGLDKNLHGKVLTHLVVCPLAFTALISPSPPYPSETPVSYPGSASWTWAEGSVRYSRNTGNHYTITVATIAGSVGVLHLWKLIKLSLTLNLYPDCVMKVLFVSNLTCPVKFNK